MESCSIESKDINITIFIILLFWFLWTSRWQFISLIFHLILFPSSARSPLLLHHFLCPFFFSPFFIFRSALPLSLSFLLILLLLFPNVMFIPPSSYRHYSYYFLFSSTFVSSFLFYTHYFFSFLILFIPDNSSASAWHFSVKTAKSPSV